MPNEAEQLTAAYNDPAVIELMVIEDGSVYVEKSGGELEELPFKVPLQALGGFIQTLVGPGERFGPDRPFADLTAPDGSRVHVIVPPVTRTGVCLTIRKRPSSRPTLREIVANGSIPKGAADFLRFAAEYKQNFLIVGGTSSGKTTLLNALTSLADLTDRILVIEDTPEIVLPHKHAIYIKTRIRDPKGLPDVTIRDLVVNAMRMRPDRIIVGECRGPEALDMLGAMNTGHDGLLTTIHANSSREALSRLETLCLMSGVDFPLKALRQNIVQALDLIVAMARLPEGQRIVCQITEVTGMENETITLSDLFKIQLVRDADGNAAHKLMPTGTMPKFYDEMRATGIETPMEFFKKP